jgi:hypothetical protein
MRRRTSSCRNNHSTAERKNGKNSSSSTGGGSDEIRRGDNVNPLRWYAAMLDMHPLTTKCVTSGLIAGSGDALCQYLNPRTEDHDVDDASSSSSLSSGDDERRTTTTVTTVENALMSHSNEKRDDDDDDDDYDDLGYGPYDWKRTARFATLGSFLVAPTVHVWYGYLASRMPGSGPYSVIRRLAMDQGIFAPIFLPVFLSCLTVLEHVSIASKRDEDDERGGMHSSKVDENREDNNDGGESLRHEVLSRLRNDVPDALLVGWSIWIPAMAFMFACVPSKFQVLYSNVIGFVWNSYLSWKTHEGEGRDTMGNRGAR